MTRDHGGHWTGIARGSAAGVLIFAALAIATLRARNAESITYDTATFIRYAKLLSSADWWDEETARDGGAPLAVRSPILGVILDHDVHPGYPALVALAHSAWVGGDAAENWIWSARLVSILGFGLLVWGVFVLVEDLVGTVAAIVAAGVTVASPMMVMIAADALSDTWSVALFTWSAVALCRCLRTGSPAMGFAGGAFAALGYLVRPEAVQLALVAPGLLALKSIWPKSAGRWSWACSIAAVLMPVVLVAGSYSALKGSPIAKKVGALSEWWKANEAATSTPATAAASPAQAVVVKSAQAPPLSPARDRTLSAERLSIGFGLMALRWAALFGFTLSPPAVVGGLAAWRGGQMPPLIGLATCANIVGLPVLLYGICGYLSFRHVLELFVLTVVWVWPGVLLITIWLRHGLSLAWTQWKGSEIAWPCSAGTASGIAVAIIVGVTIALVPQEPLNSNVVGLQDASRWLALHDNPDRDIYDLTFMVSLYAGVDSRNEWRWPVNHDLEMLAQLVQGKGREAFLIVSDPAIAFVRGSTNVREPLAAFDVEEAAAFPLDHVDGDGQCVRIYRIQPRLAVRSNGLR